MILNQYTSKRKLGKGAYGQVWLVENKDGEQFAIKIIDLRGLEKQPYLLDYLQGQIQCMKTMNSKYIMKLFFTDQDQNNKYLVCQYCDCGDLLNYQAKLPGKVFSIGEATKILADVIRGLQDLHGAGYLHRDIKSQNILVKNENGKQSFKLADFGFSKKSTQIGGTILGTQNYMSPQIYRSQNYGFQVDMWAFGVLFYFMLNMQFPFKINPHSSVQKKEAELMKASTNFSFQKCVKNSKKQLTKNCTPQTQDLFKKIFNPISDQRITFLQIRKHPLFFNYFAQVSHESTVLYGKKYDGSKIIKKSQLKNISKDEDNVRATYSIIKKKDQVFPKEKILLQTKKDQIDFLRENQGQFSTSNYFKEAQRLSLSFNLMKFYIILLNDFVQSLKTPDLLSKKYPGLKWKQFSYTQQYKNLFSEAQQDLQKAQFKFSFIYDQCYESLNQINQVNPKFKAAFCKQIEQKQFDGAFKQSYRKSTHTSFNTLRTLMKSNKSGNKMNYNLAILVISHVFNHIFTDPENMKTIFQDYFKEKKKSPDTIDYSELRQWMTRATAGQLNAVAKYIIQLYFG